MQALPHVASAWHIPAECCGYLRVHWKMKGTNNPREDTVAEWLRR